MNSDAAIEDRIALLIESLSSDQASARRAAREALQEAGTPAVAPLLQALPELGDAAREEAIRALGALGDPDAVPVLIQELEDEDSGCRWLAAEALASFGEEALVPVLGALAQGAGTVHLRSGLHHTLQLLLRESPGFVGPVLDAFQSDVPEIEIPGAASAALAILED